MNASLATVTIRTVTVAGEAVDPNQKKGPGRFCPWQIPGKTVQTPSWGSNPENLNK